MSDKVIPLGRAAITPELVLESIAKDMADFDQIYVCAFTKDCGVYQYYSGDAKGLALAGGIMSEMAVRVSREASK